jgi:methylated-DNA-[protein]-cysteine S-methyltransferase
MKIFYHYINFPLGYLLLVKNEKGLFISKFLKEKKFIEKWMNEYTKLNKYKFEQNSKLFSEEIELIDSYFKGKKTNFSNIKIDFPFGSYWEKKVWLETRKIPYGKICTYKFIAQKLDSKGYRSIGRALGKNPLLIIIPCHRVIKTDGGLGGFSAGIELKRYLLKLEGIKLNSLVLLSQK